MSRAAGALAEQLAAEYLARRGFTILERNFNCKGGELDLVCDDAGTLVFVEVRSRRSADYGTPEETISVTKRRRIVHAARVWLLARNADDRACRFDVIAVEHGAIRHLENAFDA